MVPADHPCSRSHGHNYQVRVWISGVVGSVSGWLLDYADIKAAWIMVHATVDHQYLNRIVGLHNPTCENIAGFIWGLLKPRLPLLSALEIKETGRSGVYYEGESLPASGAHIVYLAGAINGCTDNECKDWRAWAAGNLKCAALDPMRRDYRGRELEPGIAQEIVSGDTQDIALSTFVLVNYPKPSTGTDMEVRMAFAEMHKCVVTVIPSDYTPSPWLIAHSTVLLRSMAEAVQWINDRL